MLDVQPLSASLGAAVDGIQLTGRSNNEQMASILTALDEYGVLQFRGQSLSAAALRDLTAEIGPLFRHHADEGVLFADGIPEVLEMRKEPDGVRLFGGSDWHADVTFQPIRGYVSVLHALIIPPCGGDTAFASTVRAFEALSPAMQDMLRGLRAVHNYYGPMGESRRRTQRRPPSGLRQSAYRTREHLSQSDVRDPLRRHDLRREQTSYRLSR